MGPCSVWIGRFRNREECGEPKWATEKYFFQRRLFFKGMGYYSWPVKAPSNSHDIMAGLGAAGDKQRRVCTRRTLESFEGFGGTWREARTSGRREGGRRVRSHIWSLYLTQSNPGEGIQCAKGPRGKKNPTVIKRRVREAQSWPSAQSGLSWTEMNDFCHI